MKWFPSKIILRLLVPIIVSCQFWLIRVFEGNGRPHGKNEPYQIQLVLKKKFKKTFLRHNSCALVNFFNTNQPTSGTEEFLQVFQLDLIVKKYRLLRYRTKLVRNCGDCTVKIQNTVSYVVLVESTIRDE